MTETSAQYDAPAGVLVKTTLVDFPGRVACAFFLKGCNLRCPYCYNTGLVLGGSETDHDNPVSVNALFEHLERRKNVLSGLVLSGGEPLLNPVLPEIIKKAKTIGYKIKLDTNGTLPEQLKAVIADLETRPDFIAMDIKSSPARYAQEICPKHTEYSGNAEHFEKVLAESAAVIAGLASDSREYRTVLVPGLVERSDITRMAELLPADASWMFAQFQNNNCIDPAYNSLPPYIDSEVKELVNYAKTLIPGAALR